MRKLITQLKKQPFMLITPCRLMAFLSFGYLIYFIIYIYTSEGSEYMVAIVLLLGMLLLLGIDWLIKRFTQKAIYIWIIEVLLLMLTWYFILPPRTTNSNNLPQL